MRFLFMYGIVLYLFIACLSSGCSSPATTMNFLTPDRIGYGVMDGTMHGYGLGNKTMRNQEQPLELDFNGESTSTVVFLEWDLPQWSENSFGSPTDRYMRERIRHLNARISMMEAEARNNKLLDEWYKE